LNNRIFSVLIRFFLVKFSQCIFWLHHYSEHPKYSFRNPYQRILENIEIQENPILFGKFPGLTKTDFWKTHPKQGQIKTVMMTSWDDIRMDEFAWMNFPEIDQCHDQKFQISRKN